MRGNGATAPARRTDLTVANEIARQLGRSCLAMLGAYSLTGGEDSLSFRIKGSPKRVNAIIIKLDPSDTYSLRFVSPRPFPECVATETVADVYCDMLHEVIERYTGLATSL